MPKQSPSKTRKHSKKTNQEAIRDIVSRWAGASRPLRSTDSVQNLWLAGNETPPQKLDLNRLATQLHKYVRSSVLPKSIRGVDLSEDRGLNTVGSLVAHVNALTRQQRYYNVLCTWAGLSSPPAELETIGETWLDNSSNQGVPCPINSLIQSLNSEFSELQMDLVGWFGSKGEDKVVRDLDIYIESRPET